MGPEAMIVSREENLQAVFILLRAALQRPVSERDYEILRGSCPKQLVRITSTHGIVNHLGCVANEEWARDVLDPEFLLFLSAMRERNAARNVRLSSQLSDAAVQLHKAGIQTVALKGGAELVDPVYPDPADRFLSDLDLLVPRNRIDEAVKTLEDVGYTSHGKPDISHQIHAPPLWHENWPTAIELHASLCRAPGDDIIPANAVLNSARRVADHLVMVPAPADRMCHLIVHAQIRSSRFAGHWILLRDVADFWLLHWREDVLAEVRSRFSAADLLPMMDGFVDVAEKILDSSTSRQETCDEARSWSQRTLQHLANPNARRRNHLLGFMLHYIRSFVRDKELRRKYLRDLRRPRTMLAIIVNHIRTLRAY